MVFFHDATLKTRTTCKMSTFFEGLNYLNPWSHLKHFKECIYQLYLLHTYYL